MEMEITRAGEGIVLVYKGKGIERGVNGNKEER